MDADSDCEVKDKEKLQAVVTSFDQVSFLKLIYNIQWNLVNPDLVIFFDERLIFYDFFCSGCYFLRL